MALFFNGTVAIRGSQSCIFWRKLYGDFKLAKKIAFCTQSVKRLIKLNWTITNSNCQVTLLTRNTVCLQVDRLNAQVLSLSVTLANFELQHPKWFGGRPLNLFFQSLLFSCTVFIDYAYDCSHKTLLWPIKSVSQKPSFCVYHGWYSTTAYAPAWRL